ncbi:threonine-phosphate decarboxylase CobD [Ancylobacter sp. G4_0304]|uniref:threonine-phosphate decarboxylase CobD n=1 Tax=Ancylobacter sp. G4_0304 TaxID=3114289 RepID=UPI0039C6E0C4
MDARHDPAPPSAASRPRHGGELDAARARFPQAPEPWIDLSTGINPRPYPFEASTLGEELWTRLPERAALERLEAVAARAYGVPAHGRVVAASGTQPLIAALPALFPARRVAILGFGYQEHPARWHAAGAQVRIVEEMEALCAQDIDLGVVVNPNNPDGRLVEPGDLDSVAARLAARGGALVVDEAFMDVVAPSRSLIPALPPRTIILRSFGKAYGLAGLRLSFAVSEPETAGRLRAALGPWPVSGPALAIGTQALADAGWLARARAQLDHDAARLDGVLRAAGFEPVGGTSLFRLAATPDAARWFERLGRAGILVRSFHERPHWLRFGLPGNDAAWRRLEAALAA